MKVSEEYLNNNGWVYVKSNPFNGRPYWHNNITSKTNDGLGWQSPLFYLEEKDGGYTIKYAGCEFSTIIRKVPTTEFLEMFVQVLKN